MAPIGVAIIGGGLFVKGEHLPAVLACSDLSLKAIFSRSLKSAQETAELITESTAAKPDLYAADAGDGKALDDLLRRDDVAGVIIALPITNQPDYIEAALAAGKHVLAEKPIAQHVAAGRKLMDFYRKVAAEKGVTLGIAENHRFQPRFVWAAEQAAGLGGVTHFSFRVMSMMSPDNKYYKTPWRLKPEYQGGFLLDGGVHHAAAARMLLAGASRPVATHAYTALVQDFLPPIDSVTAIVRTASGATGSFQLSSGSVMRASEFAVACEKGSVQVSGDDATVRAADGTETASKHFEHTSGVKEEVVAWAEGIASGKQHPGLKPEEALADLEFLEKMFQSGEQDGAPQHYELQDLS